MRRSILALTGIVILGAVATSVDGAQAFGPPTTTVAPSTGDPSRDEALGRRAEAALDGATADIRVRRHDPLPIVPTTARSADTQPHDSSGNPYTCEVRDVTDEDEVNAHYWRIPGAVAGQERPPGHMIQRVCQYVDPQLRTRSIEGIETGYVWVRPGQEGPADPTAAITDAARARLVGLVPEVRRWPETVWVVNVPSRFHVANFVTIGPITASAPGVAATAEAMPLRVEYRFHDGLTVTCPFAGKVFAGGDDNAADACKKSFHRSTAGRTVSGSAEIVYRVDWWSSIDATRRPLGEMRSAPATFGYEVRGYEAVIR